ncbi:sugar-binding protein [Tenacibaculum sp. MAR_2009_124]|uniref:sugar-binding protein n=1 Tax=Tenacibaculum sp. MAR_2009_124 TaxID=1250059 RepID=UPI00159FE692|nr:sugar-binding protein [Tenacibaculum sp. MAR_2009_124]
MFLFIGSCKKSRQKVEITSDSFKKQNVSIKEGLVISKENGEFKAYKTKEVIEVDGVGKESIWGNVPWYEMNYKWMGETVDSSDYLGKFKLAWDNKHLYILVEVIDDYLNETLTNGKDNYWKGDYVEVFIDEDKSGGDHKFNHQAFAYHVSTEGHAIDKSTTKETIFLDDNVKVERTRVGSKYLWEMAIKLYDSTFDENSKYNIPVKIFNNKLIGFSIAYGDNDGNNRRENFMGSKKYHGNNNDDGYINSDVFGSILFVEE